MTKEQKAAAIIRFIAARSMRPGYDAKQGARVLRFVAAKLEGK